MTDETLVHLPGTPLTPEVALHRTLQNLDRIKKVAVVILWDDDTYDVDRSRMQVSELCMAAMVFDDEARRVMRGEGT